MIQKGLHSIRLISMILATGLAIAALSLIVASYEGLDRELRIFTQGTNRDTYQVYWHTPLDDKINNQVGRDYANDPEGLALFRSDNWLAYRDTFLDNSTTGSIETLFENVPTFSFADIQAITNLPSVQTVAWNHYDREFGATADINFPVYRVSSSYFATEGLELASGVMPEPTTAISDVIIGADVASTISGSQNPVGHLITTHPEAISPLAYPRVAVRGLRDTTYPMPIETLRVVGVLKPLSPNLPEYLRVSNSYIFQVEHTPNVPPTVLTIQAKLGQIESMQSAIQTYFASRMTNEAKLKFIPTSTRYDIGLMSQFRTVATNGFSWVIGLALLLAISTIGLANYFGLATQLRSIGIQRSLGASRTSILRSVLGNNVLLGCSGAFVGLGMAWLGRGLSERMTNTSPLFGWRTISFALGTTMIISLLTTLLPAWRIVGLTPSRILNLRLGDQLHRRRWLWGAPGLGLSILALIVIFALQRGLVRRLDEIVGWTGERTINFVTDRYDQSTFSRRPAYLTVEDFLAVRDAFPDYTVGWMRDNVGYTVVEASANLPDLRPITMKCGRWISTEEEQKRKDVFVLSLRQAQNIAQERKLADVCAIKSWLNIPVVGVVDEWDAQAIAGFSPKSIYVPVGSRISPTIDQPDTVWPWESMPLLFGQLIVRPPADADMGQAAERLKAFLAPRHPEGEPKLILPAGITNDLLQRRNQIYTLAGVMALLCLLIGGVGLMNLTFISVLSRAREIGIRRAVGATKRAILGQIIGETVRICLGAALVGAVAGLAIARVLQVRFGWPPTTPWQLILLAAAIAVVVGVMFGALPAWWAANLPPTRAIKTE